MNEREAICALLNGQPLDYVPWAIDVPEEIKRVLVPGHSDWYQFSGSHVVEIFPWKRYYENLSDSIRRDPFGTEWRHNSQVEFGVPLRNQLLHADCRPLSRPDTSRFLPDAQTVRQKHPDRFLLYTLPFALFDRGWILRGMENFMMDFYDAPEFIDALFATLVEWDLEILAPVLEDKDIDAVSLHDSWAQYFGLLVSPDLWEKHVFRPFSRLCDAVKVAGKYLFLHTRGIFSELMPHIRRLGIHCLSPVPQDQFDIWKALQDDADDIVYMGGGFPNGFRYKAYLDDSIKQVKNILAMGKMGRLILSPWIWLAPETPVQSVAQIIALLKEQARS